MCGFCGIAFADPARQVERARLTRMCDAIMHRGPDDSGLHVDGNVGLGHRRLSIVDVAHGHQPMSNEDGQVWIAFNGEIYNHADFRAGLEARGHRLATRCDTEAIVHLYEEGGPEAVTKLHGMFAFAIWDARTRTLLLARDRVGVKPLYYALTPAGDIVFASEIKAIFASGLLAADLDEGALPEYFAHGHTAGSRTLYHGVRKLEPGQQLVWRDGRVTIRPFWSLAARPYPDHANGAGLTPADAAGAFWERFRAAVRRMLMADVPLGVFLSGGLDSSLIVAAMRECGVEELRSFSVGFEDADASELPYARTIAGVFRTDHHEVMCSADDFFDAVPTLTWHRDLPLTFSASVPLYFVSRLASEHVKVVLTGEGSDELFAGYGRYPRGIHNLRLARAADALVPSPLRRGIAAAASRLGDHYFGNRVKRSFVASRGTVDEAYLDAFAEFDRHRRARLLLGATMGNAAAAHAPVRAMLDAALLETNPLEALLRLDQRTYLEELLEKQDQMSMAASLESRVPFLDEPLVEWAASLDSRAKLEGGVGKAVVREAALRHLPESIVRAKKRGFPNPMRRWLQGPARARLLEMAPAEGDALLDARYVARLIREHDAGYDHASRLWRLLAFQVWRHDTLPRMRAAAASGDLAPAVLI